MKPDLLLLHGALGSVDQFTELRKSLMPHFNVHAFNFSGHGGNRTKMEFSIDEFVNDTISFLSEHEISCPHIFGYSMGGYVALQIACQYPARLNKIMTLGTKFRWTKESAEKEVKKLIPEVIEEKVPKFADTLRSRHHPEDWKLIMRKTAQMMRDLGNGTSMSIEDFKKIPNKVLICIGSEDNMVTQEESNEVVNHLQNANLKVIEEFKHPIEAVDKKVLANIIQQFLGLS